MKDKLNWKTIIKYLPIVIITVIACYGLVKAPSRASDGSAENLKQEFETNSAMLQKRDEEAVANAEEKPQKKNDIAEDNRITFIGDSVMLGAVPALMETMPDAIIDAKESRQVVHAIDIIKALEAEDKLGGTVVIELGNNSYFNQATGQEIIDYLGKDRKVYWVTVYGKYLSDRERTNGVIMELAKANKNVEVIRWDLEGEQHPDWFYNDGIHLNGSGRTGFAQVMCAALGITTAPPQEAQSEMQPQ